MGLDFIDKHDTLQTYIFQLKSGVKIPRSTSANFARLEKHNSSK